VAGPSGVDLKKIQMRVKFKICLKFGLKIKKNRGVLACLLGNEMMVGR
jgi:hypothetical protein